MADDKTGISAEHDAPETGGLPRIDLTKVASFSDSAGTSGDAASARTSKNGADSKSEKGKAGRPKSAFKKPDPAPRSKYVPPVAPDAQAEADRRNFELIVAELVINTTEEMAKERFDLLVMVHPADLARLHAEKLRLNDMEKRAIGPLAGRLYAKYVGDNFTYSDEMMATGLAICYYLRNREGFALVAKIRNQNGNGKGAEQPGIQSNAGADPGNDRNRKNDAS